MLAASSSRAAPYALVSAAFRASSSPKIWVRFTCVRCRSCFQSLSCWPLSADKPGPAGFGCGGSNTPMSDRHSTVATGPDDRCARPTACNLCVMPEAKLDGKLVVTTTRALPSLGVAIGSLSVLYSREVSEVCVPALVRGCVRVRCWVQQPAVIIPSEVSIGLACLAHGSSHHLAAVHRMELTACADNSQLDKPSGLDELRQEPSDAAREQHVVPSRPSTGKGRIAAAPRTAGFDHVES